MNAATQSVESVLRCQANAVPARMLARAAGMPLEDAYAELVALEGRGVARTVAQCGEWVWQIVPGTRRNQ